MLGNLVYLLKTYISFYIQALAPFWGQGFFYDSAAILWYRPRLSQVCRACMLCVAARVSCVRVKPMPLCIYSPSVESIHIPALVRESSTNEKEFRIKI